ncbi:LysR substrate-binding domain-containing protein [Microbulbifer sp. OS29]|uniref:LysR substrate-binding domain-containing protein n=1 Tax=Microbulbifer okhotskensis TaxID=2926617 RepID=A0A9X2ERX7_9GAMM|nr:LysR substrate-binding domain-containing protein [Microbulbifer okhotskensis]MCO1334458.1 LysR substrate-binding domain-containing protein [Microbulbifer okhotskensis]
MHLRSLDLNLLPVFDALMIEQNLTRAAVKLHMSQPAVSAALKRLRATYADELFIRTTKGLRPTERALVLHPSIHQALNTVRSGFQKTLFDYRKAEQEFSIVMPDVVETLMIPGFCEWLRKTAPGISLTVLPDESEMTARMVSNGEVDLIIDYQPVDSPNYVNQLIAEEELVIIVGKHNKKVGNTISETSFQSLPQVSLLRGNPMGSPMERLARPQKLQRNICLRVPHLSSFPHVVSTTDLIGVVPIRMMDSPHYKGVPVRTLKLPMVFPKVLLQLTWHKSQTVNPAHRWLREKILELYPVLGK